MNTEQQNRNPQIHTEFMEFMKRHTVYETIPENMKVKINKLDFSLQ
jgi:hypothetical protein